LKCRASDAARVQNPGGIVLSHTNVAIC